MGMTCQDARRIWVLDQHVTCGSDMYTNTRSMAPNREFFVSWPTKPYMGVLYTMGPGGKELSSKCFLQNPPFYSIFVL